MKDEVILLTPSGAAAIAVVRIAGPGVRDFLAAQFSRAVIPMHTIHGELRDNEKLIDDPVVVLSEDGLWADLNLHGGPWVVEATIRLAERSGFVRSMADAVPEAVDPIEQEILTALPLATTELAVRTLLAQRGAWDDLLRKLSELDAEQIESICMNRALWHLLHPPSVAIVGVPNAGKSTLANQLFAQERSITADLPGTTRDWVGELANIDGLAVRLIDTPGLRETEDLIERKAIEASRGVIGAAELVIVMLDVTQAMKLQQDLLSAFPAALVVANKIDCQPDWNELPAIHISASQCMGIELVRQAIKRRFDCDAIDPSQAFCWTERQRTLLRTAMDNHVKQA